MRQAVFIGGILDFVGAAFIGSHVTSTICNNIIDTGVIEDPRVMMPGLLAALFSAALWVFAATWKQLPVSTTHSIIGALVGFGALAGGPGAVRWGKLIPIVLSWLVSPIFAALLAYAVFGFIHRKILSKPQLFWTALRWTPA